MILRPYQQAAIDAVYDYLRAHDDNPCVVLPVGSGKAVLLGKIATDAVTTWNGRVLILAHVRELLEQTADKLRRLCPELKFGIYSAGLKRRDTSQPVIVAGIQSVFQKACELEAFDLILIDECHLLPPEGEGMYRTFLADAQRINPQVRVVGFTATPFRLKSGLLCGPDYILNSVCFEVGIRELIVQGFLCPLITKAGMARADTTSLHVRGGEFVADEVEDLMDQDALVEAACQEIVYCTQDRQACLIFASGVRHGRHVARVLQERHGVECGFVCGETPDRERRQLLDRFRGGGTIGLYETETRPLKYLVNVNLLTTGFDAPQIDCIVMLRPTMSPGLFVQVIGRGTRLHPGKANCLVLDYGGNVLRHGPVDQIKVTTRDAGGAGGEAPAKECPECQSVIAAGYSRCPDCGFVFPEPERSKHDARASEAGILSGQITTAKYEVHDLWYSVHKKRKADEDAPKTLRVDYLIGVGRCQSEWICIEHDGYARRKAEAWWSARTDEPMPGSAEEAVRLANEGVLRAAKTITVRHVAGEPFDRIVGCELERRSETGTAIVEDVPF